MEEKKRLAQIRDEAEDKLNSILMGEPEKMVRCIYSDECNNPDCMHYFAHLHAGVCASICPIIGRFTDCR